MRSANERRCYFVTFSLIGWVHTQNNPCRLISKHFPWSCLHVNAKEPHHSMLGQHWCHQAASQVASHYLKCQPRSLSPYDVTRHYFKNGLWLNSYKNSFCHNFGSNHPIRPQFGTCHGNSAAVTCAKFWSSFFMSDQQISFLALDYVPINCS